MGALTQFPIQTILATKALLGLGNVDNTSDALKPISVAVQAALDLKRSASQAIALVDLAQTGATTGQVLKWDGTKWAPGTDLVGGSGGGGSVTTVFGRAGDVVPQSNDYSFAQIGSKPTTLTGYGITDATPSSHVGSGGSAHAVATGAAAGFLSATDFTKLSGIAPNATANSPDATLLARTNHTGTQPTSTVAGLDTALSLLAPLANPTFTGTVGGITKSMVGLGNVDNTADSSKPVSTAQATAIALRHVNVQFQDEGTNLGSSGTPDTFNVVGAGATLTRASNTLTLTIPGVTDATSGANGIVRLTGALGGTAAAPTALGYADASALATALGLKANAASPSFTGPLTSDGVNVTTANAMGALVVDTTKGLNTKSIAADSTFTFSGAPAAGNSWFSLRVKNTDTNPHVVTLPSVFRDSTQTTGAHTMVVPASGEIVMSFCYDGTRYAMFGGIGFLSNFAATAAPAVTDDGTKGYGPGSLWGDATGNALYWCETNATGAAVWNPISGGGGGSGDMVLATAQTVTGAKTFGAAGNVGKLIVAGNTSGTTVIAASAVAGSTTVTLPAATDTLVGKATTDTLTNKTFDTAGAGNALSISGVAVTANTGTGAVARATSPTFVTPALGAATATSLNGLTVTASTGTLTIANGKTVTANNSLTLAGTDGTTVTLPPASASLGYLGIPQNSQSANYTAVLADADKSIYHPSADTTARTWTIPANASVAFPIGTTLTFDNDAGAGALTIAITTDTLVWVGAAGSTGSRTLGSGGRATAVKVTSTRWRIGGSAELS